ncbi:hypothetical protein CERZMDRAFT_98939 [Cercospora zeae-maydis SCOH1-5]|uniref:Uncharacterized protein n=1 Tax=Cercospora zeae-maydis SCOH1-5 TaxID=717836 RepID=A0A6A6FBN2_9PEZI|nr:hypothetical protein CERZMDRAFT_98939 [Cercospora zeae-maydis SCOH1-5]
MSSSKAEKRAVNANGIFDNGQLLSSKSIAGRCRPSTRQTVGETNGGIDNYSRGDYDSVKGHAGVNAAFTQTMSDTEQALLFHVSGGGKEQIPDPRENHFGWCGEGGRPMFLARRETTFTLNGSVYTLVRERAQLLR